MQFIKIHESKLNMDTYINVDRIIGISNMWERGAGGFIKRQEFQVDGWNAFYLDRDDVIDVEKLLPVKNPE